MTHLPQVTALHHKGQVLRPKKNNPKKLYLQYSDTRGAQWHDYVQCAEATTGNDSMKELLFSVRKKKIQLEIPQREKSEQGELFYVRAFFIFK